MHFTYATPGTAEYYRRNKKLADGTTLVKEINGTDHAQMTTGNADWATGTKMWFVLIKDANGAADPRRHDLGSGRRHLVFQPGLNWRPLVVGRDSQSLQCFTLVEPIEAYRQTTVSG